VVLAFSMEQSLIERFGDSDLAVVRSLRFAKRPASASQGTVR
jgi:hypothetical protein